MLPHSGTASPGWTEVTALGRELAGLDDLADARVDSKVAILVSWPNWWAVEAHSQPAGDLKISDQLMWAYRPLFERGVTVDFCHPDEPLDRYETVIVPSLYLVSAQQGANLLSYVQTGGTAVVTFWSGIVDECDSVYLGPYGGPLRPLLGCDVQDVAPLPVGKMLGLQWEEGVVGTCGFWADVAAERDGRVLARYSDAPFAARPAVLETDYGRGRSYYIGCRLDHGDLGRLYDRVPALRANAHTQSPAAGVERVTRAAPGRRYEFLINYSEAPREVQDPEGGYDLLSGRATGRTVMLSPAGVAIVRHP